MGSKTYNIKVGYRRTYWLMAAAVKDKAKFLDILKENAEYDGSGDENDAGYINLGSKNYKCCNVFMERLGSPYDAVVIEEINDKEDKEIYSSVEADEEGNYPDTYKDFDNFVICDYNPIDSIEIEKDSNIEAIYLASQTYKGSMMYSLKLKEGEEFNPKYLRFPLIYLDDLDIDPTTFVEHLVISPIYISDEDLLEIFNRAVKENYDYLRNKKGYIDLFYEIDELYESYNYKESEKMSHTFTLDEFSSSAILYFLGELIQINEQDYSFSLREFEEYESSCFSKFNSLFGEFICEVIDGGSYRFATVGHLYD